MKILAILHLIAGIINSIVSIFKNARSSPNQEKPANPRIVKKKKG